MRIIHAHCRERTLSLAQPPHHVHANRPMRMIHAHCCQKTLSLQCPSRARLARLAQPEAFHHPTLGYVDALVMYRRL
jgi:hypothetical protein